MKGLLHRSQLFFKRNSATILTCIGGVGVVATAVTAVKATPKALKLIEEAEAEKGEKLTGLETIQVTGMTYAPTVITGLATIGCIFGANMLNKRHQAALLSAYALLDNSYKEYKKKVNELYGESAGMRIREELAKDKYEESEITVSDGKQLFYDMYSERYFESTMEDVIRAEYEVNKKISNWGGADLNEFYDYLGIEPVEHGNFLGWSGESLMAVKWSKWLDFEHEKVIMDDGLECYIITMVDEPMYDYEYY